MWVQPGFISLYSLRNLRVLFPWCLLEVPFGIISPRVCLPTFSGPPLPRGNQGLTSSSIQNPLPLIPNSCRSPRHTNSLPQTSLLLFLLQTFTHEFKVPTVLVIFPLDLHFFQLSLKLEKDTPMYPEAEAWNLGCIILNSLTLTTHIYTSLM